MELEARIRTPVVELIRASKVYRADGNLICAVREADLALMKGTFTAVMGRSGCGKSTLLNLAGAIDLPTSGDVRIEQLSTRGLDDDELSRLRRTRIGFVFQFFNLLPTLTVAENVELPLLLGAKEDGKENREPDRVSKQERIGEQASARSQPAKQVRENSSRWWKLHALYDGSQEASWRKRVADLLDMVGLGEKASSFPHQLSGGEMQRVAIARALAHEPSVVIADEPTGNLDSANSDIVLRILQRISQEMECTVLMATHSKEAAEFAGRVLSMRDGRIFE